jgi:hypothetical protein
VLKKIGDALKASPAPNPNGAPGITAHFDVGSNAAYRAIGPAYATSVADDYLVQSSLARGGELVFEAPCVDTATVSCQFPAFPGTISWKIGYQILRDAPVGASGQELSLADQASCVESGGCRRRFDAVRKDMFHYVLNAHARGIPKEPCLNADGSPNLVRRR